MASQRPVERGSKYAEFVPGTIPDRKLNGGLYTGEAFTGPWGNVPIVPDSGSIMNRREFLGYDQPVAFVRPGNSEPVRILNTTRFDTINAEFPSERMRT
jgi:hypothetical protein